MRSHFRVSSVAILALAAGVLGMAACGSGKNGSDVATPATNAAAAGTADTADTGTGTALQFFARFPVLWLGQTFDGLSVTRGQITGTVTLVYGACTPSTSVAGTATSGACKPPIQIDVSQPAGASPAKAVADAHGQTVSTVRGAQAVGNSLIFNDGLTVTITLGNGAPPIDAVFAGLTLANAQAVNMSAIAAGDLLTPLNAAAPAAASATP